MIDIKELRIKAETYSKSGDPFAVDNTILLPLLDVMKVYEQALSKAAMLIEAGEYRKAKIVCHKAMMLSTHGKSIQ